MDILNQARKNKNELNIQIYGQIGGFSWFDETVTSDQVYKELENFGNDIDVINLYINSPGGSVTEGCAIYSALKRHKAVKNVYIDGQCSSIASVIAMAGDKIAMSPVATMMKHNPITALAGDAEEMRKTANILDIMKETIINAYVTKSHLSREEISNLMDTTTYFTAKQAIEKGFATEEIVFDILTQKAEEHNLKMPVHVSKEEGDGPGYDIRAWDKDEKELHIEVKASKGRYSDGFEITRNEIEASKNKDHPYIIYRVYNLDIENRNCSIEIYSGPVTDETFKLEATKFIVYKK